MFNQLPPLPPSLNQGGLTDFSEKPSRQSTPAEQIFAPKSAVQFKDSFELFNAVLQKAYRHMASSQFAGSSNAPSSSTPATIFTSATQPNAAITEYSAPLQTVDKITPNQAADNILSFITRKLESDAAFGADQDSLLQRLNQGLEGFKRGYNQAKEQIEAMGLMTPTLAEEINETFERVTSGIQQLNDNITGNTTVTAQDPNNNLQNDNISQSAQPLQRNTGLSQINLQAQQSQSSSFSLALTTQDGDRVSIAISRSQQSSFSAELSSANNRFSGQVEQQQSNQFSLEIVGDLNEDELKAINNLLQDIDVIANDFYAGKLDQAFNSALSLAIDGEQLSSLKLQLQQTTVSQALAAYQANALPSADVPKKDLAQLLNNVERILAEASQFAEPLQLIDDVISGISKLNAADLIQQSADSQFSDSQPFDSLPSDSRFNQTSASQIAPALQNNLAQNQSLQHNLSALMAKLFEA